MSKPIINLTDKQWVFDAAAKGILEQGYRSIGCSPDKIVCRLRGANGAKCAVGHCISDEDYDPEMEMQSGVERLVENGWIDGDQDLLGNLQRIHDCTEPAEWPDELRHLAVEHGLNTKVVDDWEKNND